MNGAEAILTHRRNMEYDGLMVAEDSMVECEMLTAALCYIDVAKRMIMESDHAQTKLLLKAPPKAWPWPREQWTPSIIAKNNIMKAGVLLAGEWDRVDRKFG